jgi:hypothetical protein
LLGATLRYALLLLVLWSGLAAQDATHFRTKWFHVSEPTLELDSALVLRAGIQVSLPDGQLLPDSCYQLTGRAMLEWLCPINADSVQVTYPIIRLFTGQRFFRKDTTLIVSDRVVDPRLYDLGADRKSGQSFEPFSGLNKSGSLSRAITVGNSQDAVLNSNLNLQLSGDLGENTTIRASITDNSLPIQPDGSTQNLREFDRVYLELDNQQFGRLRAGDFNIERKPSYFLQFDKRVSGAGIEVAPFDVGKGTMRVEAVGSLARGKFARNQFQGIEGNQGPYKLQGNAGELFIIIISGSERVYIDGILMKRGQEYDYIMDYNTGELTFTALRPITKDRRISIEFQYTEQQYLRTLGYGQVDWKSARWRHTARIYSEQDNPNQPIRESFSEAQRRALANAGNDPERAFVPGFAPQDFDPERPLYRITDSLGVDTVFVYSVNPNEQLFQVNFTFIGPNQGDYVLDQTAGANGRIFKWVPPVNGVPQGQYRPIRRLPLPNQLQVMTYEIGYQMDTLNQIGLELATSRNVVNRFSEMPDPDERGWSGRLGYSGGAQWNRWKLDAAASYELVSDAFETVERIRDIEFQRDWNLTSAILSEQQLGEVFLNLSNDSGLTTGYGFQFFQNGSSYTGSRHRLRGQWLTTKTDARWNASYLTSADSTRETQFFRQISRAAHFLQPNWWVGVESEAEHNLQSGTQITGLSYWFLEGTVFTGIGDTTAAFIEMGYFRRNDDTLRFQSFDQEALAQGVRMRTQFKSKQVGHFEMLAAYRTLQITDEQRQDNITGRLRYNHRFFRNLLTINTFYEAGIGSEPVRNITYIRVPTGTGTHTWIDYNDNGIPELDEFEPARFQDEANFVKTFLLTNDFQRTSRLKTGASAGINPKSALRGNSAASKLARRFSTLTNYQAEQQNLLTGIRNGLNPFDVPEFDSLVVAGVRSFRNSVFFNRGVLKFGGDYTYQNNATSNLLSFGVEAVQLEEHLINLRYQFREAYQLRGMGRIAEKRNETPGFVTRNYELAIREYQQALVWQPGQRLKLTADYHLSGKVNRGDSGESLIAHQTGLEFQFNDPQSVTAEVRVDYINNNFSGQEQSPVAFEMLNGLRPGSNTVWRTGIQKTINNYLQFSLQYEGRTAPGRPTIHLGSLQVKALF